MNTNEDDNTVIPHTYGKTVVTTDIQIQLLPDNIKQCYQEYLHGNSKSPVTREDILKSLELWFSKKQENGREVECEFTSDTDNAGYETCDNVKRQRIDSTV